MTPGGSKLPADALLTAVNRDFGSLSNLEAAFTKAAVAHFGSGWTWLVHNPKENKLKVMSTSNEVNPMQRECG